MTEFKDFGLNKELLESLKKMKFLQPTDIQAQTIPVAMKEDSIMVKSKTGSGKTGAYLIPLIQMSPASGKLENLILVPTRELAIQVFSVFKSLAYSSGLKGALVYGGASISKQAKELSDRPEFIIGTPGRIKDMKERGYLKLGNVKRVVLDEADLMLDMGFYDDVSEIIGYTKENRKMMLFSATMSRDVKQLASEFMDEAIYIGGEDEETPSTIKHAYIVSQHDDKLSFLMRYINDYNPEKAIIFSNTKSGASKLSSSLRRQGYQAVQIHGDLTQRQREDSIARFRRKERFLVATDVAARGVDIPAISHIINYDMPREDKTYIHRVGRTARFGKEGVAMSIILPDEKYILSKIERVASINIDKLPMDGQAEEMRPMRDRRSGSRGYGGQRRSSQGSRRYGSSSGSSGGRKPYRSGHSRRNGD